MSQDQVINLKNQLDKCHLSIKSNQDDFKKSKNDYERRINLVWFDMCYML